MTVAVKSPAVARVVTESVLAAIENTFESLWGEKLQQCPPAPEVDPDCAVAGIISFTGDICWSLSLVLTDRDATGIIQGFTGMEIPFTSPDMGDAVAELTNILAGEIVAQLDRRHSRAQMGLPMIAEGCPLKLMTSKDAAVERLKYHSKFGGFDVLLVSALAGSNWVRK